MFLGEIGRGMVFLPRGDACRHSTGPQRYQGPRLFDNFKLGIGSRRSIGSSDPKRESSPVDACCPPLTTRESLRLKNIPVTLFAIKIVQAFSRLVIYFKDAPPKNTDMALLPKCFRVRHPAS